MEHPTLPQRALAEGLGTAGLLAAVVGSGIMAERLCPGQPGLALLCNSLATAGALVALLLTFGPTSGAHLNPLVSLDAAVDGAMRGRPLGAYLLSQLVGGLLGVVLANVMFDGAPLQVATQVREGGGLLLGEVVASAGLLLVVRGVSRHRPDAVHFAVAAYILAAYWFTSSTSFANPAVTLARAFTNSFAGIRLADVPAFIGAQLLGAALGGSLARILWPPKPSTQGDTEIP